MSSEEGEWQEDGEDSDKEEHLTCVPHRRPRLISLMPWSSSDVRF